MYLTPSLVFFTRFFCGVLYVRSLFLDSVFTVDLSTAKLTLVTVFSENGSFAFDAQDNMYVAYSALSRINLPAFSVTAIGALSRTLRKIAFTGTGQLMGISYDSLYTIDVATAHASPRLLLGVSYIDGFVEERPATKMLAKRRGGYSPHWTIEELEAMRQRHIEARAMGHPFR